jgi:hypothetical protein
MMNPNQKGEELELFISRAQLEVETAERTRAALAEALARKRRLKAAASKHEQARVFPHELQNRMSEARWTSNGPDDEAALPLVDKSLDPFRPPRRRCRRQGSARETAPRPKRSTPDREQRKDGVQFETADMTTSSADVGCSTTALFPVALSSVVPVAAVTKPLPGTQDSASQEALRVRPLTQQWRLRSKHGVSIQTSNVVQTAPGCGLGSTFATSAFAEFASTLAETNAQIARQRGIRCAVEKVVSSSNSVATFEISRGQFVNLSRTHPLEEAILRNASSSTSFDSSGISRPITDGQSGDPETLSNIVELHAGRCGDRGLVVTGSDKLLRKRRRATRWDRH